jgi:hypothetical protein
MYEWSEPVIKIAEEKGIKVDCIDGQKVVKKEIMSRVEKLNPNFIFLNGHGDSESFYGYENEVVIETDNATIFRDKIVFSRACNCLEKLGKDAVEKHGCKSFIGYEFEFVNVRQTDIELKPRKDKISEPIWEVSNSVPIGLIKGATVNESVEASHKKATKEISRLLFSNELGAIAVMKAIIVNDDGLKYHGDGFAKI